MSTRRGFVIILSAPSGAGKTTLMRHLVASLDEVRMSISATTRDRRPGETEGEDYFFLDRAGFEKQLGESAFLEYAEVFGNYYGTPRAFVEENLAAGQDVVLDIDWQGARQVRERLPAEDVISLSILPPSRPTLQARLEKRGRDEAEVIRERMELAGRELSHCGEYEYLVINDDLEKAQADLVAIIRGERCRRARAGAEARGILASFGVESALDP